MARCDADKHQWRETSRDKAKRVLSRECSVKGCDASGQLALKRRHLGATDETPKAKAKKRKEAERAEAEAAKWHGVEVRRAADSKGRLGRRV